MICSDAQVWVVCVKNKQELVIPPTPTIYKELLSLSERQTCGATFYHKGNPGGWPHGMNGRQAGLFRSCHATLCCMTLGKSPTFSEPSIAPDTDTPHRVWETMKMRGIKPYPREGVRVLNKA